MGDTNKQYYASPNDYCYCRPPQAHAAKTGSAKAKALLANWDASLAKFWQLVPPAEKNTPECNPALEAMEAAKVAVTA